MASALNLEDTKKPVLHGGSGLLDMGPAGESFYYSRTRLKAEGVLTIDGAPREVWGEGWMDQQWGDFSTAQVGWDWFNIQLDDNTELMAFLLWGTDTGTREMFRAAGTYILRRRQRPGPAMGRHRSDAPGFLDQSQHGYDLSYGMGDTGAAPVNGPDS